MKKIFSYALSLVMMMTVSFSNTSCDADDVAETLGVGLQLYQQIWGNGGVQQLEGTAWYNGDLQNGGYTLVLAFDSNSQGRMYEIENNRYTSAQYVSWSYDTENNTLTIGGQTYNVTAFTAGQSLTMNIGGKEYTFYAADPSSLLSVEEVNGNSNNNQGGDVSGYFAGTAWAIGASNNQAYLYYFETATTGTLYLCDLDSSGNLTPTDQKIAFTYQFGESNGQYVFVITYGDEREIWYYVDMAEDGSTLTVQQDGNQYTYTRININGSRMQMKF